MAPDSRFWRHQLGEAHKRGRRHKMLRTVLPLFLLFTFNTSQTTAKTEPVTGSYSVLASYKFRQGTLQGNVAARASFSRTPVLSHTSPTGPWSSKIQIQIADEPAIQRYIRHLEGEGRPTMEHALERSRPYLPVMTEILESRGVPAELIAVVSVESCFDGEASHRGAGGYWQLMAATARRMGLRVDRWVDERFDPVKSTEAAAKYLRLYYDRFHSWELALAAYNAGGDKVSKALNKRGSTNFWELARRGSLPAKTQAYVPKVLAAAKVMRNLEAHGFNYPRVTPIYDFEPVRVKSALKLQEIARWINVPVNTLQELNPSLRLDALPPDCNVNLNIPSGARDRFDLAYEKHLRR